MDALIPVAKQLIIRAKPMRGARSSFAGLAATPRRRTYYFARWPDGTLAAAIHPREGIWVPGAPEPWCAVRTGGVRALAPAPGFRRAPLASLFVTNAGLGLKTCRLTLGEERTGGWELVGRGWRGGSLRSVADGERVLSLRSDGDPPSVFFLEPVPHSPAVPLCIVLFTAFVLIEHEIKLARLARAADA